MTVLPQNQEIASFDFASGATVFVDLGARGVKPGERVIVWSEKPAKGVRFKTASGDAYFRVCDDGLYLYRPLVITVR